jgi:hypothetical protein
MAKINLFHGTAMTIYQEKCPSNKEEFTEPNDDESDNEQLDDEPKSLLDIQSRCRAGFLEIRSL